LLSLLLAQTAPGELAGHKLRVPGASVEGTTARLSEVEREIVNSLPTQAQAERLLQYAISHQVGATDEIKARVKDWRGKIVRSRPFEVLLDVAHNGADLRVRAAAIEIELAILDVAKTPERVEALLRDIEANPSEARQAIWILGFMANRGVETARIHGELRLLMHAPDEIVRCQAVAAIAYIGTDATVQDLVDAFHRDPSSNVRINGGGCGLAHCGMLTRAQRMQAIPGLIAMVEDKQLDSSTVMYGYRALREITDETLPDESQPWREWYAANGAVTTDKFRKFETSRQPN